MIAKKVFENIEFKRGNSITKSLNIGQYRIRYSPFNINELEDGVYLAFDSDWYKIKISIDSKMWSRSKYHNTYDNAINDKRNNIARYDPLDLERYGVATLQKLKE